MRKIEAKHKQMLEMSSKIYESNNLYQVRQPRLNLEKKRYPRNFCSADDS